MEKSERTLRLSSNRESSYARPITLPSQELFANDLKS